MKSEARKLVVNDVRKKEKTETVILTTLSMMTGRKTYSYYYVQKNETRLYCDGLLSVEAGTKYYLSQERVDRIVVIASKETSQARFGDDSAVLPHLK